jgi:UDPglucose 6-dehydrogenase
MARAVIVGGGTVGEPTGRGLERAGHSVSFVDVSEDRVRALQAKGLAASTILDLSGPSAFVFIAVPTPHDGPRYNLSYIQSAARAIGAALRNSTQFHTVVVRSTVPPGTTEGLVLPILERESGRRVHEHFEVAANPEFLRASSNHEDFLMPWMTVLGSRSARTVERMCELYKSFGGEIRTFTNPAKAEFVKCAHNIYNATKISFWNEMWMVADRLGFSSDEIASVVARSSEGSINPMYGIRGGMPFGGACLPKDTYGFIGFARELGVDVPLLESVARVNEKMEVIVQSALERGLTERPAPEAVQRTNGVVDIREY